MSLKTNKYSASAFAILKQGINLLSTYIIGMLHLCIHIH